MTLAHLDLGRFDVVSELCRRAVEETADHAPPMSMQAFILDGASMARVVGSVAAFMTGDLASAYELVRPLLDAAPANAMLGSVAATIAAANGQRAEAVALTRHSPSARQRPRSCISTSVTESGRRWDQSGPAHSATRVGP